VAGTGIDVTALRGYWTANTERIIFCEMIGSDAVAEESAGYESSCVAAKMAIFGEYLRREFTRAGVTNKKVAELFPSKTGGTTGCVSNWLLGLNVPTPEQYGIIRQFLGDDFLRREYEDLRREYEDLRRPFALTAFDEWGDVWKFSPERNQQHPTQKPLALMAHIIKASTRPASIVLDPFMGSGTTGVAAIQLGRKFIGIERDERYFDIACKRIEQAVAQGQLFAPAPAKQEQCGLNFGEVSHG
jgi:site-specific DNA-methyltransferase (adenine-specific)